MEQYLKDTKFAVENLIRLITEEENQIINLNDQLVLEKNKRKVLQDDFMRKELDPDENFTEGDYFSSFYRQAKYYEEIIKPMKDKIFICEKSINNKKHSISSLSGAVLQIAKQGISIKFNGLKNCPTGRTVINGVVLKAIIWHGRNQAMHYEEDIKNIDTISCFNDLGFVTINNINLAKDVIDLLGWKTYIDYEADMISLIQ
ncbi:MAG: hypothetical protein RIN55_06300 [Tissierellaceae bacterium]|nr:hypothetical protein [Tissierellaceae bacterium]